jgi:succinyl-CoA synthetase beta subunit
MRPALLALALLLAAPAAAQQVATLVAIPVPAGMPRAQLVQLFDQSQPQYRAIPGLIRKYYTIGDDGKAGGIYLWASRAAAEAWYSEAWRAAALKRWGKPAEVSYFEVPIVLDGTNAGTK